VCGIIGYVGYRDAYSVLLDGLKRLEYRGYDSAGIGIIDSKLQIYKEVGEVSNLEYEIPKFNGKIGIGHTRWATHGKVSKENAHPHLDCKLKIAVVHNGIIDNFKDLKNQLVLKGHNLTSQTDSEIIAHLIEESYTNNLCEAVIKAVRQLKGSYAIVAISETNPNTIFAARNESPLVIGIGDNENLIASDIPAILKYTNRVKYLDDGEICILNKKEVNIINIDNEPIDKKTILVNWTVRDAEKAGYSHFMLKEIHEQPHSIYQGLVGRISEINRSIEFPDRVESLLNKKFNFIHIIGCGTSYYAGYVGKYLLEKFTKIPVQIHLSSEFRYYPSIQANSLVIAITQSGETADTLGAIRTAKKMGASTLVISNVIGSTAMRISDGYILTQSGPEIGVAATKTFTSQILMLYLLSIKIASKNKYLTSDEIYHILINLKEIPREIRHILELSNTINKIANELIDSQSIFFIGRGINYPLALEGALKLKEISYIHAEGFAAGELKHGPFALLTEKTPVIAIVTHDSVFEKMIGNIGEIKARGSPVIAITDKSDELIDLVDSVIPCPYSKNHFSCIPIAVILQLLSYYVAKKRKCSIDKPRNLAKSVTVE
jgi:glucosamine--fructose-6-phosphate aminotransferase (isomerizing)